MSRLRIVHRTGYSYKSPATASYNEVRMLPFSGGDQFVFSATLDIHPSATQNSYVDYWGTRVSTFEVLTPHTELSVTATSVIEVRPGVREVPDISWEDLKNSAQATTQFVEFLHYTRMTEPPAEVAALAQAIVATGLSPAETARAVCQAIYDHITYMRGVTGVHSTAAEAWAAGKGVCQDIAHVTLGALRSVGIPARYVSGYLHPKPDAALGETIVGESHAWVEWFTGDWFGYDPTNMIDIGERHVLIAHGRDYRDVSPLRGVYAGASASGVFVRVEITREA